MDTGPIQIEYNKLLDWLLSRRLINKGWQQKVVKIRSKITGALSDMPEHPEITQLLSGSYLNYFHAKKIVEVLRDTEADTKNFFGRYGSQRMKDWQDIVSLYEKENIYLAEEAQTLARCFTYEIPAAKSQILKLQQLEEECDRKELECVKNAEKQREKFYQMCKDFGLRGDNLFDEMNNLVEELPSLYQDVAEEAKDLKSAVKFYEDYLNSFLGIASLGDDTLPLLKHVVENGNTTVYEWKYKDPPVTVEAVPFKIESHLLIQESGKAQPDVEPDTIDFGAEEPVIDFGDDEPTIDFGDDNGDIDWGSIEIVNATDLMTDSEGANNFEIVVEESGLEGGVARDTEALSVLDYKRTRVQFIADLLELEGFFEQKVIDSTASSDLQGLSASVQASPEELRNFLVEIRKVLMKLEKPKLKNLILMRTSQKYVDRVVANLLHQKSLSAKMLERKNIFIERRQGASEEVCQLIGGVRRLGEKMIELQKQIEKDLSERYKRQVKISGIQSQW